MSDGFDNPAGDNPTTLPGGFRAVVTSTLQQLGYRVTNWEYDGVYIQPSGDAAEQYIGLSNLYRRAQGVERQDWPDLIRDFVIRLGRVVSRAKLPDDLMTIAGQLRPRLGRPFPHGRSRRPWGIPLPGTGLEINLVIDFPETIAYVTEAMLATTSRPVEDLLDIALANLRGVTVADYLEPVLPGGDVYIGHSGDGHDAARALLLDELLPEAPAGYWVVVPTRDEIAVCPVSMSTLDRVHTLRLFAVEHYRENPYPISDDVFWVYNGQWHTFEVRVDSDSIMVVPPAEFMAVIQDLQGREEDVSPAE